MAFKLILVAALAVAVVADPLRYKRQVGTNNLIAAAGGAAAEGSGWAADNHQASVIALGIPASQGGWGAPSDGVPASISINNQGGSEVGQLANDLQVTSNDGQGDLAGLQTITVEQLAASGDSLDVAATGGEAALASSSDAVSQGQGSSSAAGDLVIISEPNGNLGMAKP